jgi:hypothetical protein
MKWIELKNRIYYTDGSWRDIYVPETTMSDWKKWVDIVNHNYKVDWFNGKTNKHEEKIDFTTIIDNWSKEHDFSSTAKVYVDNLQINAHFFDSTELENDIDPGDINSIEDHEKLIKFMSDLSIILDKEVILTPENQHEFILVKVYRDKVLLTNDIDLSNETR